MKLLRLDMTSNGSFEEAGASRDLSIHFNKTMVPKLGLFGLNNKTSNKSFKRAPLNKQNKNASPKKPRFLDSRNSQQSLSNIDPSEKSQVALDLSPELKNLENQID